MLADAARKNKGRLCLKNYIIRTDNSKNLIDEKINGKCRVRCVGGKNVLYVSIGLRKPFESRIASEQCHDCFY